MAAVVSSTHNAAHRRLGRCILGPGGPAGARRGEQVIRRLRPVQGFDEQPWLRLAVLTEAHVTGASSSAGARWRAFVG